MTDPMNQSAPHEEIYTIKASDPDPHGSGLMGASSHINLERAALAHPLIRLAKPEGEVAIIEADVYAAEVEGGLEILILCPRCRQQLRITSDRKEMQFEPTPPEFDPRRQAMVVRGKLSIEPFQCTWEMPDAPGRSPFGSTLCRWAVGVDNNLARSA